MTRPDAPTASGGDDLWAITSYFNPAGYRRRLANFKTFRKHLQLPLVAVELAFGLDFVPLRSERYDLVLRKSSLELPSMQALLETLSRALLRRRLETLAGYDTSETGRILAGG